MKAIICQTLEEFNILENRIHEALKLIPGYSEDRGFLRWALPDRVNTVTGYIACPIAELDNLRGAVMIGILSDAEKQSIVELDPNDETWFPRNDELI